MQNAQAEWRSHVKRLASRKSLLNYNLGEKIVDALGYSQIYSPKTTVLDMYPGPALFSSALNQSLHPEKHILLEPYPAYRKWLSHLADTTPGVHHCRSDPFRWSTFQNLSETCGFSPETQSRKNPHNSLLFTANLLHPQGEQLATQYINCIANQSWIQKYGRVRLLLWMRSNTAEKMVAGPNEAHRHRISCQTESCCDIRTVMHSSIPTKTIKNMVYPKKLESPLVQDVDIKNDFSGMLNHGISLLELTPKEHQIEHIDEFDYVILKLFILKSTPLRLGLNNLGPGAAEDLAPHLQDLLDCMPVQLTLEDLKRITKVFAEWPFKPETLIEYYEDGLFNE